MQEYYLALKLATRLGWKEKPISFCHSPFSESDIIFTFSEIYEVIVRKFSYGQLILLFPYCISDSNGNIESYMISHSSIGLIQELESVTEILIEHYELNKGELWNQ